MLELLNYIPPDVAAFIPAAIIGIFVAFPMFTILRRTGKSLWWLILCFFPPIIGMVIVIYILAYTRWPKPTA